MSTVQLDEKGRVVLRKRILEAAGIEAPCTMLALPRGSGVIEFRAVSGDLSRAQRIAAVKLQRWREEEHRGEKQLLEMTRDEVARHRRPSRRS